MQRLVATIHADTESQALNEAAAKLDTFPENISLAPAGSGKYTASVINADAEIKLAISDDGLTAYIEDFQHPVGAGKGYGMDTVNHAMRNAGVRLPSGDKEVRKALQALQKSAEADDDPEEDETIKGMVIVRGKEPVPAVDARVEPLGDWKFPVLPGDAVGKIHQAQDAKDGTTVTNSRIAPRGDRKGKPISFPEDAHCYIDTRSLLIRSETYGLVEQSKQEIRIHPIYSISSDAMRLSVTLYETDQMGKPLTVERMNGMLEALEVSEPVHEASFLRAMAEVKEKGHEVKDVAICKGVLPKNGKDGHFQMIYKDKRLAAGEESEDGSINFRSRGMIRSVTEGLLIGKLVPPQKGSPGRDIYGKVIPSMDGLPFALEVGEGVEPSPDGTEFTASESGMVVFSGKYLTVTDVFQTKGDVNMSMGNLDLEKGSVHVRGSVLSGFSVTSPGNVLVDEVIENAQVTARGSVEVKGGILMDGGGKVVARGEVSAMFASNAHIEAGGDIDIAHETNNCTILTKGAFYATRGRGKIIGSTIRAARGVEANEVGSELGVETNIFLGLAPEIDPQDLMQRKRLRHALQKIYAVIGMEEPKKILARTVEAKRPAVANLLKTRIKAEHDLKIIEDRLRAERERILSQVATCKLKVHKVIHPGTIVHCLKATHVVKKPLPFSQLYYDRMSREIVVSSM